MALQRGGKWGCFVLTFLSTICLTCNQDVGAFSQIWGKCIWGIIFYVQSGSNEKVLNYILKYLLTCIITWTWPKCPSVLPIPFKPYPCMVNVAKSYFFKFVFFAKKQKSLRSNGSIWKSNKVVLQKRLRMENFQKQ